MTSSRERVDIVQFMEELLGSLLMLQNVNYKPVGVYTGEINLQNWPAILYCVGHIYDNILKTHRVHLIEAIQTLGLRGNCDAYVDLLGEGLFKDVDFSWALFKEFLAHICALSSVAYRARITFLSDDIVVTGAIYVKNHLDSRMESLRAWQGFEQDCVISVLKMEEAKQQGLASPCSKTEEHDLDCTPAEPDTVVLVKQPICYTYANQTGGKAFELEVCDAEFSLDKDRDHECEPHSSKSESGRDSVSSVSSVLSSDDDEQVTVVKHVLDDRRCPLAMHVVTVSMSVLEIIRYVA